MTDTLSKQLSALSLAKASTSNVAEASRINKTEAVAQVVVTQVNAKQLSFKFVDSQQSFSLARQSLSDPNALKLGQTYLLSKSAISTSSSRSLDPGIANFTLSTLPANYGQSADTSDVGKPVLSFSASQSLLIDKLVLPLSKLDANTLINLGKLQANSPAQFVEAPNALIRNSYTQNIKASVEKVQGSQVSLLLENGTKQLSVSLNLPKEISQALKTGQSLSLKFEFINDKAKVASISLPNQKAENKDSQAGSFQSRKSSPFTPQGNLQNLLSSLSKGTLDTIRLPNTIIDLIKTNKQGINLNQALNSSLSGQALPQKVSLDKLGFDNLSETLKQSITKSLSEQGIQLTSFLSKGIEANIVNTKGVYSLQLRLNESKVSLGNEAQISTSTLKKDGFLSGLNIQAATNTAEKAKTPQTYNLGIVGAQAKEYKSDLSKIEPTKADILLRSVGGKDSFNGALGASKSSILNEAQINKLENQLKNTHLSYASGYEKQASNTKQLDGILSTRLSETLQQQPLRISTAFLPNAQSTQISSVADVQSIISQLGKQVLAKTHSQTLVFDNILQGLEDSQNAPLELQQLLKQLKSTLPQQDTNVHLHDATTLKQLIGAPLNTLPLNAISPSQQGGFINALVSMLQVSLASRLQKVSNFHASKVQQAIPEVLKRLIPDLSGAQGTKLAQDFSQFDAKHMLSAEVAKLLSNHQQHKLKSADSSISGPDSLYYALPNLFNRQGKDIELLIKRENDEQANTSGQNEAKRHWTLSMKFDINDQGELLAKTKVIDDTIDLQIYTSNESLRDTVQHKLPWLQKRLALLGLNLGSRTCQLGKIPQTLDSAHYSVFETNA